MATTNYLQDVSFLKWLDNQNNKESYARIIVLSFADEEPIAHIEGKVQAGSSLTINNDSSVRRTCQINVVTEEEENDLTDVDNLLSMNKKIKLQIGYKNTFFNCPYDNDYFWFNQGIFVIQNPVISHSSSGISIQLSLQDKMCLLNGTSGGTLPASVTFDTYDQIVGTIEVDVSEATSSVISLSDYIDNPNNYTVYKTSESVYVNIDSTTVYGQYWMWDDEDGWTVGSEDTIGTTVEKVNNLYDIIQTVVCNFGGESLNRIIINGVPTRIKQLIRNNTTDPLYVDLETYQYSFTRPSNGAGWAEIESGEDCGYTMTDFVYASKGSSDLTTGLKSNITTVLDIIKNFLGNFEYFYDIDGNFVFQEIPNYLNTQYDYTSHLIYPLEVDIEYDEESGEYIRHDSSSLEFSEAVMEAYCSTATTNSTRINYILEAMNSAYSTYVTDYFRIYYTYYNNSTAVTNNFLAIDTKAGNQVSSWIWQNELVVMNESNYYAEYNTHNSSVYNFMEDSGIVISYNNTIDYNNIKNDYHIWGKDSNSYGIHYHIAIKEKPKVFNTYYIEPLYDSGEETGHVIVNNEEGVAFDVSTIEDTEIRWRTELYLQGRSLEAEQKRPDQFQQEIIDNWTAVYYFTLNSITGKYEVKYNNDSNTPPSYSYWYIDYIEPTEKLFKYSIDSIGIKRMVYEQENINRIYDKDVPDIVLISNEASEEIKTNLEEECEQNGYAYVQVDSSIYDCLALGTLGYSAREVARSLLYQYITYNESVSIQTIPILYLEPNTRITINDVASNIYGDYIIKNISLPLDGASAMSIQAIRALERY